MCVHQLWQPLQAKACAGMCLPCLAYAWQPGSGQGSHAPPQAVLQIRWTPSWLCGGVQIHQRASRIDASCLAAGPVSESNDTTAECCGYACYCCDHGGLMSSHDVSVAPALRWAHHIRCTQQNLVHPAGSSTDFQGSKMCCSTQVYMVSRLAGAGNWHSVACLSQFVTYSERCFCPVSAGS